MKMSDEDRDLEHLFQAARQEAPALPEALTQRILADAAAQQPDAALPVRLGWRDWVEDFLGGWVGLGGLAAASAAGIWLGFAPPSGLPDAGAVLIGQGGQAVDVFQGNDMVLALAEDLE